MVSMAIEINHNDFSVDRGNAYKAQDPVER